MRSRLPVFALVTLLAASVAYKLIYHLQEKIRFSLLPVISDYQLGWLLDLMTGLELLFLVLLLFRAVRGHAIYCIAVYFSIHLAALTYQKFITVCNECVYHSNFVGESINVSILLFLCAIVMLFTVRTGISK